MSHSTVRRNVQQSTSRTSVPYPSCIQLIGSPLCNKCHNLAVFNSLICTGLVLVIASILFILTRFGCNIVVMIPL